MTAVGTTTSMLVIAGDGSSPQAATYDPNYVKAQEHVRARGAIRIVSERALLAAVA
jgi:hypothetical protein